MLKPFARQRASARMFTHAAAEVRCASYPGVHVGVLRDISEDGMFLYSDFKPPVGTKLGVILRSTFRSPADSGVYCEGIVVRVEQVRIGAAPGIAVQFMHKIPFPIMSPVLNQHGVLHSAQKRLSA